MTPTSTHTDAPTPLRDGRDVVAVYERLRAAILRGELAPGCGVSQAHLARAFGAGRTPLREALRLLQHEGLVLAAPNRRVRIAALTAADFEGIVIARLALEAVAIRITVPTLAPADVAALEGDLAQLDYYQRVGEQPVLGGPHRAFHRALVAAAGPRIVAEIGELSDHMERYRLRFGASGRREERRAEHRAILDAAAVGDAAGAAARLAEHYVRTSLLVFDVLDRDRDLGRLRITIGIVAPGAEAALPDGRAGPPPRVDGHGEPGA